MRYVALIDDRTQAEYSRLNANGPHKDTISNIPTKYEEARLDRVGFPIEPPGFRILHQFEASTPSIASRYYHEHLLPKGCPRNIHEIGNADAVAGSKLWRYRGDFGYAKAKLAGIGLPPNTDRRTMSNEHWKRLNILLGQLCDRYHRCQVEDGVAHVDDRTLAEVRQTLAAAEQSVALMFLMGAAAIDAIEPAYAAFGIESGRRYRAVIEPYAVPAPELPPEPTPDPTPDPAGVAESPLDLIASSPESTNGGRRRSK